MSAAPINRETSFDARKREGFVDGIASAVRLLTGRGKTHAALILRKAASQHLEWIAEHGDEAEAATLSRRFEEKAG